MRWLRQRATITLLGPRLINVLLVHTAKRYLHKQTNEL